MATYSKCPKSVSDMAAEVIGEFEGHASIRSAGIKLDLFFAESSDTEVDGEAKSPALVHDGYPCKGLCRILNGLNRAKGNGDAEVLLDKEAWEDMEEDEQKALLDSQLSCLQASYKDGVLERDAYNRPKLRIRKYDRVFKWFDSVAERHGAASQERMQAKELLENAGQIYFPWLSAVQRTGGRRLNMEATPA